MAKKATPEQVYELNRRIFSGEISAEDLIKFLRKLDLNQFKNVYPVSNYRLNRKVVINFELVYPDTEISTKNVLEKIKDKGLRPADSSEGQMFFSEYPELHEDFPIVTLGSPMSFGDNVIIPDIYRGYREHHFPASVWLDFLWHELYRFLAVRESEEKKD